MREITQEAAERLERLRAADATATWQLVCSGCGDQWEGKLSSIEEHKKSCTWEQESDGYRIVGVGNAANPQAA